MKKFPNYRVVQKGRNFLVEKEVAKDRWISILEIYIRLIIFFSGLWILLMILLKAYPGISLILISILISSMLADLLKFKSLDQAKNYIEKKFEKYEGKRNKSFRRYYSTKIQNGQVFLTEYTDQENRKEKLLKLK